MNVEVLSCSSEGLSVNFEGSQHSNFLETSFHNGLHVLWQLHEEFNRVFLLSGNFLALKHELACIDDWFHKGI